MLNSGQENEPRPKCYFTHSVLPAYLDHAQLPMKKRPFVTVREQVFNHTLNMLLPAAEAHALRSLLAREPDAGTLRFATIYMKLADLVSGDFFTTYIKSSGSNNLMLSKDRASGDNIFSLHEGVLRLEVDKATFERMGLEGKPIPSEGRKHVISRCAIELNLRLPSMVRGKKGFERILWAFRNVLNNSVKWLFYDFKGGNFDEGPIAEHAPLVHDIGPSIHELHGVRVPDFSLSGSQDCASNGKDDDYGDEDDESITDLLEWLTLAFLRSPRIQQDDKIDAALSRYVVPRTTEKESPKVQDLVQLRWHGFVPPSFLQRMILLCLKATGNKRDSWFAVQAKAFHGSTYAFIQRAEETLTWEYED